MRLPQVPVPVMRAAVRALVRPVLHPRFPVRVQRRWLELVTGPTPLPPDVDVRTGTLGGRPAEVLAPRDGVPGRTVLHLHGGGFTVGSPATHRALAAHLAAATGATVHLLDYRLAPEHPYPRALDDVRAAWAELLDRGADPATTALTGDSAGGWLALTTALRLRDAGEPLPAVLGLISPWLDLTGASWPDRTDAMLQPVWLRRCAAAFAAPPEAAPLAADLAGLPPMVVQVGSAGVAVDLRRLDGLWHVALASAGMVAEATAAVLNRATSLAAGDG